MVTVLLVEDEADLRALVAFNLEKEGYRVLEAAHGIEALEVLEKTPVDMVIADVMMPVMDGLELCARIQERPELERAPFLFVTAKGDAEAKYVGLRAGADDYINKPFELDDLLARVRGRLARQDRVRALRPRGSEPRRGPSMRWCPACGQRFVAAICPVDGVETLDPEKMRLTPIELEPGTVIGTRFRIDRPLGDGAMGAVHAATQLSIGRSVALKVLHPHGGLDEVELRRFHQEARAASLLQHPNVLQILDFGVDPILGLPFLAMALVEGRTLRTLINEGPLHQKHVLLVFEQVVRALAAAHAAGVVHRDLKPENVMVQEGPDGGLHVTVLDFGVAKLPRPAAEDAHLTGRGEIVGTPRSMSPEQVRGETVGPATDFYGLGCLLHEMLTGQAPYAAETATGLLLQHLNGAVPELPEAGADGEAIPRELRALHRQLLLKEPTARPATALAILEAVELLLPGTNSSRRGLPPATRPNRVESESPPDAEGRSDPAARPGTRMIRTTRGEDGLDDKAAAGDLPPDAPLTRADAEADTEVRQSPLVFKEGRMSGGIGVRRLVPVLMLSVLLVFALAAWWLWSTGSDSP